MFFINHIPVEFKDSYIHKKLISKLINIKTISSILLYGVPGTGKYILSQLILTNIFGKDIKNNKKILLNKKKETLINCSNYHYELYLTKNGINQSDFKTFLCDISANKNIFTKINNIVLIKNIEYLNNENIMLVKKMIEKNKLIFILISSKYVDKLSDCMCIRVPIINKHEILSLVNSIIEKENLTVNTIKINEIIDINKRNISLILYNLFIFNNNGSINNNFLDTKIDLIIDIVYKNKNEFKKVRKLLYELMSHNIDRHYLLKYSFFKTVKLTNTKQKLLEFTHEIDLKLYI